MKAEARKQDKMKGKSKTEIAWEEEGDANILDFGGIEAEVKRYEPATFKIGSLSYTPDYLHVGLNGEIIFVEVKASKRQAGYAYSMARLKATAEAFPWFYWMVAVRGRGTWSLQWIG